MTTPIPGTVPDDDERARLIRAHLQCFVPLAVAEICLRGGAGEEDFARARGLAFEIAEHGDAILFLDETPRARKRGFDTETMFGKLVDGVAVLAFCPGGITVFGCHFDAEEVRRGWGIAAPQEEQAVDPARSLPIMRVLARLEMRWFGWDFDQLAALLPLAVMDQVLALHDGGGVTEEELERVSASLEDLEQRGDDLFVFKKGESRQRFVQLARALAVLSFLPAGVTRFGVPLKASDMVARRLSRPSGSGESPLPDSQRPPDDSTACARDSEV